MDIRASRRMKGALALAALVAGFVSVEAPAAGAVQPLRQASSTVEAMFVWWNGAIRAPGALTPSAFGRFWTPNATLVIDGVVVARGLDQLAAHFTRIQTSGARVEIAVPFEQTFRSGDLVYTYHVIRSMRAGIPGCMLAAGHARLAGPRIATLSLVRTRIDAKDPAFAARCRLQDEI